MKHRRLLAVVVVATIAAASQCALAANSMIKYVNTQFGFSLDRPESWTQQEGYMGTAVLFLSPLENKNDAFMENVNVVVEDFKQPLTLKKYTALTVEQLKQYITDAAILSVNSMRAVHGPYSEIVYTGRQGQYELKWLCRIYLSGKRAYVVTYTAEFGQFNKYLTVANPVLSSFKVF